MRIFQILALTLGYHVSFAVDLPLRINSGGPATDGWVAGDVYLKQEGKPFEIRGRHDVSGVSDPAPNRIYESVQHRDHSYEIPLPAGTYRIRFHFTDRYSRDRKMDYRVNDQLVIDDLSIFAAAGGTMRALILEMVT